MRWLTAFVVLLSIATSALAKVYFQETFDDASWESRWVQSKEKSDYGKFKLSHGKYYGDAKKDLGIQTSQDARFYALSAKFEPFSNKGKDLVLQYTVKHEQNIDCGGGYIKLHPDGLNQEKFNGDSKYYVMFGPDICGSTKRVHFIIHYKGENHLIEKTIKPESDELTHVYTMVLSPDQSYRVLIDQKEVASGKIEDDWKILPPRKIKDPNAKKPEDWDDRAKIDDPNDVKPADWDNEPEYIDDPEAEKPEDWDDDMDGEWVPPKISNPEYKGEWRAKLIDNPAYKGVWVHPEIDNPEYKHDAEIYLFPDVAAVSFDLWQVKSGTIFDNIIVTDSLDEAKSFYAETTGKTIDGEKKAKEAADEAARKKAEEEAKLREEEERKRKEAEGDDDEDDEDDDEDDEDDDFEEEATREKDEL
jgi:calreticulin